MSENKPAGDPVSRRTMLKRIGAAGAIAWATPVISSLTTPAFAASAPDGACDQPGICPGPACIPDVNCSCHPRVDGQGGFCEQDGFCTEFGPLCPNGQSDCGAGTVCVQNCCGAICMPPCGADDAQRTASVTTGRRTNG